MQLHYDGPMQGVGRRSDVQPQSILRWCDRAGETEQTDHKVDSIVMALDREIKALTDSAKPANATDEKKGKTAASPTWTLA